MPQIHGDTEIRREGGTSRRGDKERGRQGEGEFKSPWRRISPSPRLLVSLSPLLLVFLSPALWLCGSVTGQTASFEKQAISSAQEMSASDLDKALPNRPFAGWFSEVIGPKAGVVWQLTECGEQIGAGQDLPACAEVNASLPGGRKVFVTISVGTFKKGLTGKPSFFRAVIEQNERFYQVRRLGDLPERLRAPEGPSTTGAKKRITNLPTIKLDSARIIAPLRFIGPMFASLPPVTDGPSLAEEPPGPPPPPSTPPTTATPSTPSTQDVEQIPESVSQSRAITKVKPVYPPNAKKMKATGPVEVEIMISEAGLVIEATAISGHLALRSAAVEAARKWVFKPAILNGAPVRVKSVLTFVFAPSTQ
jgi:TonB family protein